MLSRLGCRLHRTINLEQLLLLFEVIVALVNLLQLFIELVLQFLENDFLGVLLQILLLVLLLPSVAVIESAPALVALSGVI